MHATKRRLADGQTREYVYAWRSGGPEIITAIGLNPPELTPLAMGAFSKVCRDRKLDFFDDDEQTLGMVIRSWKASLEWGGSRRVQTLFGATR